MNVFKKLFSKPDPNTPTEKSGQKKQTRHPVPPYTPEPMAEDVFWKHIASSFAKAKGDYHVQQQELSKILEGQPPLESIKFQNRFYDYVNRAYRWDLWGVAFIMNGGCSDDYFFDFRGWLISRGKEQYFAALKSPESLAEVAIGSDEINWEGISWAAHSAYSALTGKIMPTDPGSPTEPAGKDWKEEELAELFPVVWAKWGN